MRLAIALVLSLAACSSAPSLPLPIPPDQHVPDYAKRPFEPFSRTNAIAIAEREWRAFGSMVDDAAPGREPPLSTRKDRESGLWQRVGDYWWYGQDASTKETGWTSRYDETGTPYEQTAPAWSAAFISYVMRTAGAGAAFTYSPLHADYINAAAQGIGVLHAERPDRYAPVPGDLICLGRGPARDMRYEDLPAPRFFAHCDLVTATQPSQLTVIGGNVGAAVTLKHIPVTPEGLLSSDGRPVDARYNWFVVVRVRYDR